MAHFYISVYTLSFIILAVFVGIVGSVGLFNLNRNNTEATAIYKDRLQPIALLAGIDDNVLNIRTNTLYMLIERDSTKLNQRYEDITKRLKDTDGLIAVYESSFMANEEKSLFLNFKEAERANRVELAALVRLLKNMEFGSAQNKMETYEKSSLVSEEYIDKLIALNESEAAILKDDIQGSFNDSFIVMVSILALACAVAILFAIVIPRSINKPIKQLVEATDMMSKGNLNVAVRYRSKNELGHLSDGVMSTVRTLKKYIGNIAETLSKMANGDLSVSIDMDYIGDFAQIKNSMVGINDSLNNMLSQINQSSNQVLSGAGQVSSAAQSLSQGTAEQASSIEELSATIQEISNQIAMNAQNAQSAKMIAADSSATIESSNNKMMDMITAMKNINETSRKISKIIKTIDDIAFQTNILALNAAVEAARAGEAGKGFAVVADEVRNLAGKSAEAAKDTAELIENSILAVDQGTKIADETANSLISIVESAKRSADLVSRISDASTLQASSILQTTQGVLQISHVVQNNSSTAEQSAAASEVLSGQADMLNQLVAKFTLRSAQSSLQRAPTLEMPKQIFREEKLPKGRSKY